MKFTIVGHAALYIETDSVSVLIDPWLLGSCYWRSWWNYPPPSEELLASLDPDFIYISHLHWDHYHGPSLRMFDRDKVTILLPKALTTRMVDDIRSFKFKNVIEMPHGKHFQIAPDLKMTSYQFGPTFIDSAIIASDGKTTLYNANDAKLFGLPFKQTLKDYPKIDFVFRSHSSASPIPYCIDGFEENLSDYRTQDDYATEFSLFALSTKTRYAVPFASNHCFLHKETKKYNSLAADPVMSFEKYSELARNSSFKTECVVMPAGSSWSDKDGFHIESFDYSTPEKNIQALEKKYADKLEKQYAMEDKRKADFKAFEKYFSKFLSCLPFWLKWVKTLRFVFHVKEGTGKEYYWVVDTGTSSIEEVSNTEGCDFVIESSAYVLIDCCKRRLFNTWGASKRLKVRMHKDNMSKLMFFYGMLDFYENDGLPLSKNFTLRQLGVRMRRWRELVEIVRYIVKYKILKKPFIIRELFE